MAFKLKNNYCYYLFRQIIDDRKVTQFKLYNISDETIAMLVDVIPGTVTIHMYNEEDNSRIDLTNKFGKIGKIDFSKNTFIVSLFFYCANAHYPESNIYMNNLIMTQENIDKIKLLDEKFSFSRRFGGAEHYSYFYYKLRETKYKLNSNVFNGKIDKSITKGSKYEEFIGKKYEKLNKEVIYNGLVHGKKDNGIDLIVNDENSITFVQCKNWVDNEYHKLNQKDLRAFIGDCFMYLLDNQINKNYNFHFVVSDNSLLTKSAELYLKENRKIKYKVVPYEEEVKSFENVLG